MIVGFTSLFSCFLTFSGFATVLFSCSIFASSDFNLENQVRLQLYTCFQLAEENQYITRNQ